MVKEARGLIAWSLRKLRKTGITLPPFGIYLLPEQIHNAELIRHEKVHWKQYEQRGAVRFYVGYLLLLIRYGYENHPWEIEARKSV